MLKWVAEVVGVVGKMERRSNGDEWYDLMGKMLSWVVEMPVKVVVCLYFCLVGTLMVTDGG